jgi:hypothetical protein
MWTLPCALHLAIGAMVNGAYAPPVGERERTTDDRRSAW